MSSASVVAEPGRNQRDLEILAESRGDADRFAAIFDAYYPEIFRYARSRLGDGLADDVASETFLLAFRKRAGFDVTTGYVRAWLYGIATNLIRRHRRDEERKYRALAQDAADELSYSHDDQVIARVTAQSLRRDLAAALAALPPRDRDVLLLIALAQLDYTETAAALGIPYGTVCSRLNRARRRVRESLGAPDDLKGEDHG